MDRTHLGDVHGNDVGESTNSETANGSSNKVVDCKSQPCSLQPEAFH